MTDLQNPASPGQSTQLPQLRQRIRVDRDNPPELAEDDLIRLNLPGGFYYFCKRILPYSFEDGFIDGHFIEQICNFMEMYRRTARVSARDHFKSTAFKAYWMYKLMVDSFRSIESHYFSYSEPMAAYHTSKIKQWIKANPYFKNCKDLKKAADSVLEYTWDGIHIHTLNPQGLLSFKRGIHTGPYGMIFIDDPLKDPENPLLLTKVKMINTVFEAQIMDMPDPQTGELHIVGTPQTKEDFFFDPQVMRRFGVKILPAIQNEAEGRALWPEYMSFAELSARRHERPKLFDQEYMCKPGFAKESYLDEQKLYACVNRTLENCNVHDKMLVRDLGLRDVEVFAGLDIGKKAHPSHLSVYAKYPVLNGEGIPTGAFKLRQLISFWMDGWDYTNGLDSYDVSNNFVLENPTQIEYIKLVIENLAVDRVYFDGTRGEFEGFFEQGLLSPSVFIPVMFNTKTKTKMAELLDKKIISSELELINDQRQLDQMLMVLKDLNAVEGKGGHGDSFWSNGLALLGFEEGATTTGYNAKPTGF